MRKINVKLKEEMLSDPEYSTCMRRVALKDHFCRGRITLEHALIYASKQIDEKFAILSICAYAHGVDEFQDCGILDKEIHEWIAVNRMTPADEAKYYKRDWQQLRRFLNGKYGTYTQPKIEKTW